MEERQRLVERALDTGDLVCKRDTLPLLRPRLLVLTYGEERVLQAKWHKREARHNNDAKAVLAFNHAADLGKWSEVKIVVKTAVEQRMRLYTKTVARLFWPMLRTLCGVVHDLSARSDSDSCHLYSSSIPTALAVLVLVFSSQKLTEQHHDSVCVAILHHALFRVSSCRLFAVTCSYLLEVLVVAL